MGRQGEEESPGQVPAEDRVPLFDAGSLTLDGECMGLLTAQVSNQPSTSLFVLNQPLFLTAFLKEITKACVKLLDETQGSPYDPPLSDSPVFKKEIGSSGPCSSPLNHLHK